MRASGKKKTKKHFEIATSEGCLVFPRSKEYLRWPRVWDFCLACGLLKTRGPRDSGIINPNADWDWCWEPGRREQESLVGSRGTPHPLAVGFPAIATSIPLPFSTGRGIPWPFPRLANLGSKVLNSAGRFFAEETALQQIPEVAKAWPFPVIFKCTYSSQEHSREDGWS